MSIPGFDPQNAGAVVQITLGQVFNEVRQVHDLLNTLTGTSQPMQGQLQDHETRLRAVDGLPDDVKALGDKAEKQDARLRTVELKAAAYAGGAVVLSGVSSLITWALTHH